MIVGNFQWRIQDFSEGGEARYEKGGGGAVRFRSDMKSWKGGGGGEGCSSLQVRSDTKSGGGGGGVQFASGPIRKVGAFVWCTANTLS